MSPKPLKNGAPGEIRTPDHLVRSQVLYPAELRARAIAEAHCTLTSYVGRAVNIDSESVGPFRILGGVIYPNPRPRYDGLGIHGDPLIFNPDPVSKQARPGELRRNAKRLSE